MSFSMAPYYEIARDHYNVAVLGHLIMWVLVMCGIGWAYANNRRRILDRDQVEEMLKRTGEIQFILNKLLYLALEPISLQKKLENFISYITSLPIVDLANKGAIFTVAPGGEYLELRAHVMLHEALITTCARVEFGHCLCGRAAERKEVVFKCCLDEDHDNTYTGIGPHGHYCVPILNADQALLGVFTVYTRDNHLRDAKTEEVLAAAANIMAGIIERHTVQDALHQSREQYRSLVENLENTYFFYSYNPNGMLTYLSPSITKILGYSQQEFMGNYHAYLTDNQANQSLAAHMAISLRGEKQPPYLLELLHKDGMRKWLEIYENPIMGEGGEVVAVEGLANDVTVKIINESALRRTNKQLEKIFETTLFFIAYLDRAFNFIRVNRAYADASACSPDSFVGKNHFDLYPNEENQRIFEEVVATGVPYTVHAKPFEYPDQPERGVTYWDWALYPIKGMDGAVEFLILALVDVTLTKRHELELKQHRDQLEELVQKRTAALLESEEQVRLLLNSTAEAIYGFDRNGNCTFCNPACLRMLGYADQQDLLGKNIHEVIHHTRSDGTPYPIEECNFHKVYELGEPAHVEDELLWKKDGSSFPVEIWSYPIIKRDEVLGVVVTFIDITDRKNKEMEIERTLAALEKARRDADLATKAKSNFLANMSHEIRTPMNAIIGLAHLAQQTELSLKQRDYLQKIDISAKSLLGIINDILDFSKIEADKLTMESVDFYLDNVLANVVNTVSYKVKENGLILRTNISEDLPFNLKGDPLRLNQILANLLSNAVKFTGKGEVVIDIALEETRGDLVKLRFSVKDTGIGLNTEQIKGLFQAFNQADTSTTRMYGGTGLGLAICKKLINMMNGNIWVKSVPKEGSTFLFTAEFKRQVQPSQEIAIYSQELQGSHVLIGIEDEMTRRFLRKAIESYALIVDAVSRGEDVVAELRRYGSRKLYSLLILDGKMSGMSGLETVKRIKELPNSVSMSQVIMLINADGYAIQQAAEKEGLDNFLMKPVIRTRLINALLKGLGKKSVAPQSADLNKISEGNIHVIAGARILLVEDNTINQQVARELLESVGLKVTIAENGKEGVRLATEDKFDLILMDIQMPVMDGFEATRRIRSKGNEFNEIPVIAMTAHAMGGDREKSLAVGMNDHVTKPIDPDVLYATLLKYIAPRNIGHPQVRKAGGDVTRGAGTMELAGFDSVSGLKRVAGNQKLYLKLLAEFAKENEHNVDLIKEKVSQGDRRDACRLVHTLKGTAGNLGATSLHLAALNLERCIGRNGENFEELLGVLNEELQMALKILKDYLAVQHAAKEKLFPEEIVPISRESIIDKLRNIVEFSKIGDMKAASVFDDIYLHLVKMFPDEAAIMEKSMAVLDFSEARLAAEQILNKIME